MNSFDWQPFLKQWAEEMLDAAEDTVDLPDEAVQSRWLGFSGATEREIEEAEHRLGVTLPPSYRAFLQVANGWRQPEAFWAANAGSLRSLVQVSWSSVPDQEQAEAEEVSVLQISDDGDGVYLLNPKSVDGAGEWESWFFADWNPGADKYPSFQEMMQVQYQSWHEGLPLLKGEMTEEGYEVYAARFEIKTV